MFITVVLCPKGRTDVRQQRRKNADENIHTLKTGNRNKTEEIAIYNLQWILLRQLNPV
jgi:hypothetical protein